MSNEIEELRKSYRPTIIKVLFVGESAPAGGTFFYKADSNLFNYTQEAFSIVCNGSCGWSKNFLEFFKNRGFYLDDLCLEPVNHLDKREREQERRNSAYSLGQRIKAYKPKAIAVVMASSALGKPMSTALEIAQIQPLIEFHPFPAQGNQRRYVNSLVKTLRQWRDQGIFE